MRLSHAIVLVFLQSCHAFVKFGCMHTTLTVRSSEIYLSTSVNDITATTAKVNWILINDLSPSGIVDSFSINLKAIGIVGEQSVSESQAANTLASCLVAGNVTNKTLTVPGNATSALLTDLSMLTPYIDIWYVRCNVYAVFPCNALFSKHYSSIYKVRGPYLSD